MNYYLIQRLSEKSDTDFFYDHRSIFFTTVRSMLCLPKKEKHMEAFHRKRQAKSIRLLLYFVMFLLYFYNVSQLA